MAAPYVSGVAGLIKAWNPGLSNLQIIDAILDNVDITSSMTGRVSTDGRLNAYKALSSVYCEDLPVRIMDTGNEYSTLQEAYDEAVSGHTIQSKRGILTGYPVFNLNKSVSIDGGFNCGYTENANNKTTLTGAITFSNGTVTMENFVIE